MIYVILSLVCSLIVSGSFIGGFVLSSHFHSHIGKPALNKATEDKPSVVELSEEQKRELKKRELQIQNFFAYNGDEMPKPEEKMYQTQ